MRDYWRRYNLLQFFHKTTPCKKPWRIYYLRTRIWDEILTSLYSDCHTQRFQHQLWQNTKARGSNWKRETQLYWPGWHKIASDVHCHDIRQYSVEGVLPQTIRNMDLRPRIWESNLLNITVAICIIKCWITYEDLFIRLFDKTPYGNWGQEISNRCQGAAFQKNSTQGEPVGPIHWIHYASSVIHLYVPQVTGHMNIAILGSHWARQLYAFYVEESLSFKEEQGFFCIIMTHRCQIIPGVLI